MIGGMIRSKRGHRSVWMCMFVFLYYMCQRKWEAIPVTKQRNWKTINDKVSRASIEVLRDEGKHCVGSLYWRPISSCSSLWPAAVSMHSLMGSACVLSVILDLSAAAITNTHTHTITHLAYLRYVQYTCMPTRPTPNSPNMAAWSVALSFKRQHSAYPSMVVLHVTVWGLCGQGWWKKNKLQRLLRLQK